MSEKYQYAELHCHSAFSFLDGASLPEELINQAKKLGLTTLALTDHNGLYGVVRFSREAKLVGIKTVFGAEITLNAKLERPGQSDPDGEHLVILAKNPQGYRLLSTAISEAQLKGSKAKPIFSIHELAGISNGTWYILTGCRKGPLSNALYSSGPKSASRRLGELTDLFGRENVVVEIWDHGDFLDVARNDALTEIAAKNLVSYVATNNVHYAVPQGRRLASIMSAIRSKRNLDEIDPWLPVDGGAFLKSPLEQINKFLRWPGATETAAAIGAECSFDLTLITPELPSFDVPSDYNEDTWLIDLVEKHAVSIYGEKDSKEGKQAWKQLYHELDIITKLGFSGYFLVVKDIVEFCKNNNILCQGRGSAANSAVCYVLGITNVDAIKLGLLFERFLSQSRDGPPDIDLDIESTRRDEVINYVYIRYGRKHAAQVANVITYRTRSAIRDIARALGLSENKIDLISNEVKRNGLDSLPEPLKSFVNDIRDMPRHLGIHSGGIVLTKEPVSSICPVEWARKEGRSVLQWDKEDCKAAGLVKFDLLGLGMLEAIHKAIDLIESAYNLKIDLAKLPQEDAVYEMFARADTVGVFQVESRAQMGTLPRMKPKTFYDLVVEVALIRPGPIQGGSVHPYLRRRNGLETPTYPHPLAKPALEKTLGIPLFQEQLMRLAIDVAGFSAQEADELRAAMGAKRSKTRMALLEDKLMAGMRKNGVDKKSAELIKKYIIAFSGYGFPESHAISFAYIVYASAWIKFHYPAAFLAALLNSQPMGFWSVATLVSDAKRHSVNVLKPDVNLSKPETSLEINRDRNVEVRLGLKHIRGIGSEVASRIDLFKPYSSLNDLSSRASLLPATMEQLAQARALDSLITGSDELRLRRTAIWESKGAVESTGRLPGTIGHSTPLLPSETLEERASLDIYATGMPIDNHPISLIRENLKENAVTCAKDLIKLKHKDKVRVAGYVTHRQKPPTANGVVFMNLEDETGLINVIFSKGAWARWRDIASEDALLIYGFIERAGSTSAITVVVEKVLVLNLGVTLGSRDYK